MHPPLTLVAVGDLQLGDSPTTVGYGFYSRHAGTPIEHLFDDVRPALAGAAILFGNLETMLVPPGPGERRRSELQLRGEPQFARALRSVGFTLLNVANNHAAQHGDDVFQRTVETVRAAGIECCGVRGTDPWTSEPVLLDGGRIGVLGYCLRPRQYGQNAPPYAEATQEEVCRDVRRLKATVATVLVSLHWGEEFVPVPSHAEMAMGRAIIDAGASVILGHHPHVSRPVERYGAGLIAYSMGNFIGDMIWYAPFRRGLILRCALGEDGPTDVRIAPTHLRNDYRPVLVENGSDLPRPTARMQGLDADAYAREVTDTVRRQRAAAYRAALRNLPRTPVRILSQLVAQTIRNRIVAIAGARAPGAHGRGA